MRNLSSPQTISGTATVIPPMRFAGAGWGQVEDVIRANEGGDIANAVVVQPGGKLAVVKSTDAQNSPTPLTVLPPDRMAAGTRSELHELQALDPTNEENWTLKRPSFLRGENAWEFQMDAPYQHGKFTFLAFRDPSRNNEWQVSPIYPNYDAQHGHDPHMVTTLIGGTSIPVICGPRGSTHKSLSSVRAAAAKWTLYTSNKLAGRHPGFSI
jgi:hypothetical protein